MFDRETLLNEASGLTVAEYLGMEVVKKGSKYYIPCPGHFKRLGKEDYNIGNAVLTDKGYHCYACHKNVNVIDMTMEYTGCTCYEAMKMVADACGGISLFTSDGIKEKDTTKLPLSTSDLELIGLSPTSRGLSIVNMTDDEEDEDLEEGVIVRTVNKNLHYVYQHNENSLLNLFKTDPKTYNNLIKTKAKEAMKKYENAIKDYCSRDSKKADFVFSILNDEGYLDNQTLLNLKNAFQKKYWRAKEIYESYVNNESCHTD